MRKQLTAVLLIFVFLLTMAGCSTANAVQRADAAEDMVEEKLEVVENKLEAAEDKLEDSLRKAVSPAPASEPPAVPAETQPAPAELPPVVAETQPAPVQTEPAANVGPQKLTKEQAEKVALDYLGLTAAQVSRLRTEYEFDDGIPQYDVELHHGDWEYEFEIHAENGRILSYDKDHKYD